MLEVEIISENKLYWYPKIINKWLCGNTDLGTSSQDSEKYGLKRQQEIEKKKNLGHNIQPYLPDLKVKKDFVIVKPMKEIIKEKIV